MYRTLPREIAGHLSQAGYVLEEGLSVPEIAIALNKTVISGGKRVRPALCLLISAAMGIPLDRAKIYARAVELTHSASLTHDDVVDNAARRRNKPTLNDVESNKKAVLGGDLLLARVMVEISGTGEVEVIRDLAQAVEDLVRGEWLQLDALGVLEIEAHQLDEISRLKTGSLIRWACLVPARLLRGDATLVELCRSFGDNLGVAFQMVDDVIDYDVSSEKLFAQDLKYGLVNWVTMELLEANPDLAGPVAKILQTGSAPASGELPWSNDQLEAARERVRVRANAKLVAAHAQLDEILARTGFQESAETRQPYVKALRSAIDLLARRKK
ncbi:polyprenyl synthetase family protein [bacterium]|nr:polyprenyl synthetase family protein [bacterium]